MIRYLLPPRSFRPASCDNASVQIRSTLINLTCTHKFAQTAAFPVVFRSGLNYQAIALDPAYQSGGFGTKVWPALPTLML